MRERERDDIIHAPQSAKGICNVCIPAIQTGLALASADQFSQPAIDTRGEIRGATSSRSVGFCSSLDDGVQDRYAPELGPGTRRSRAGSGPTRSRARTSAGTRADSAAATGECSSQGYVAFSPRTGVSERVSELLLKSLRCRASKPGVLNAFGRVPAFTEAHARS